MAADASLVDTCHRRLRHSATQPLSHSAAAVFVALLLTQGMLTPQRRQPRYSTGLLLPLRLLEIVEPVLDVCSAGRFRLISVTRTRKSQVKNTAAPKDGSQKFRPPSSSTSIACVAVLSSCSRRRQPYTHTHSPLPPSVFQRRRSSGPVSRHTAGWARCTECPSLK
jgi:hypothetical protein